MIEPGVGLFTEDDLRARAGGELLVTADEIGVQVGFDDVLDLEPVRGGFGEIFIHVSLRIDDGGFAIRADQVRSVGQTSQIELLEIHYETSSPVRGISFGNL